MKLRPYQEQAVNAVREKLSHDRCALVATCVGSGKSLIIAETAKEFKRAVIVQPAQELVLQNYRKLVDSGLDCTMIDGAHKGDWNADYIFTTPQTLSRNLDKLQEPDVVFADECFTPETLITTNNGDVPIKDIKVGDTVLCATGWATVEKTIQKQTKKLITIEVENGKKICGTPNHPILSEHGWIRLDQVERGTRIISIQDMPAVWERVPPKHLELHKDRKRFCRKTVLFTCLLNEVLSGPRIPAIACRIYKAWWKRYIHKTPNINVTNAWRRLGFGIASVYTQTRPWLSQLLQIRCRKSKIKNRDRSGWMHNATKTRACGQKGLTVVRVGVENIPHNEQRSRGTVYNLQVSKHPSYFANGFLVHNCQYGYIGKMWNAIRGKWNHCKLVGLTATPRYYKQSVVYSAGWMWSVTTCCSIAEDIFGAPVIDIDRETLRKMGYGRDIKMVEVRNIPRVNDSHVQNLSVYFDLVNKHLIELFALLKSVPNALIYCDSIAHAELLNRQTHNKVRLLFGTTPKKERAKLIEDFLNGEVKYIATVGCGKIGLDLPNLSSIIILTNVSNPDLLEQMVGRLNRGTCDKTCYYNSNINISKPVVGESNWVRVKKLGGHK